MICLNKDDGISYLRLLRLSNTCKNGQNGMISTLYIYICIFCVVILWQCQILIIKSMVIHILILPNTANSSWPQIFQIYENGLSMLSPECYRLNVTWCHDRIHHCMLQTLKTSLTSFYVLVCCSWNKWEKKICKIHPHQLPNQSMSANMLHCINQIH